MVTLDHPAMQVSSQKSQVSNKSLQTKPTILPHQLHKSVTFAFVPLSFAVGYSSNHSSLTDLSHRRSASGGSASTGIGSILEPSEQQVERTEKESRTTPTMSAACHQATERPSTPAKVPRWPTYCCHWNNKGILLLLLILPDIRL